MNQNEAKNGAPLPVLTANQEKAVRLVFLGKLTEEEIATALGLARTTVQRWKREPAFKKRLGELRAELREEMGHGSIADSLERLIERDARWKGHRALRLKRAERFSGSGNEPDKDCDLELATGMYKKKTLRRFHQGELVSEEIEPIFDMGLYRALHDDELLTAKELGEIVTKAEVSGPGGKPIQMQMEVNIVGYAHGGILDALRYWKEIADAGRLPQTDEDVTNLLSELDAREKAIRQGKPVPPMSEPYIPALDILNEQED